MGIPLLGIPVILPGIPNDQNTQLFCWVFWSLGITAVGYSRCWVFRTVTNMVKPKFGYKHLGAYNLLENQLLYDKQTGDIYTYYDKPKNVLDKIASRHDTCYAIGKNKNDCDRVMVDEINNIPYNERPWGTFAIKQIIDKKQKLGLGVENHNKILSEELHKCKRKNHPRRRIIVNHIDEIFAADLVEMQKFAKLNKGYR